MVVGYSSIGHKGQDVLIEDSYFTGLEVTPDGHADGIQFWGFISVSNITIRHNYIDAHDYGPNHVIPNAAVFLADADYFNVTIENNYFRSPGNYNALTAGNNHVWSSNHQIRGNR